MLIDKIKAFIKKYNLIEPNSTIVLGFSGGPDSVFLLHLLTQLRTEYNLNIIAAHLDHEWRPDSHKDAEFCAVMAKELNVTCVLQKMSELTIPFKFEGSKEEFGRKARRLFLEKVLKEHNADAIALAHHLQDQEETFFIRLIRGTTLSGLCAMRPKAGLYIRPLLETNKPDILDYLNAHNISYLTDPSNVLETFLRNRIRKKVIPALQECDERFDKNFLRTLYSLQDADDFLQKQTEKIFGDITKTVDGRLTLTITQLFEQEPYMQNRLIMHWLIFEKVSFVPTETFLDEIKRFLRQPESKEHRIHRDWSLVKEKKYVFIKKFKNE